MEENKQRPQIEEIYHQPQPTTILQKLEDKKRKPISDNRWLDSVYKLNWFQRIYLKIKKGLGFDIDKDMQKFIHPRWKKVRKLMYNVEKITTIKKLEEELNDKTKRMSIYDESNNPLRERVAEIKERINEINKLSS